MRWPTRQHVLSVRAESQSLWHRWFAWRPIVMKIDGGLEYWVWLERVERKWSHGKYGKTHWRYRPVAAERIVDYSEFA